MAGQEQQAQETHLGIDLLLLWLITSHTNGSPSPIHHGLQLGLQERSARDKTTQVTG
jgi:hypothetical protein